MSRILSFSGDRISGGKRWSLSRRDKGEEDDEEFFVSVPTNSEPKHRNHAVRICLRWGCTEGSANVDANKWVNVVISEGEEEEEDEEEDDSCKVSEQAVQ